MLLLKAIKYSSYIICFALCSSQRPSLVFALRGAVNEAHQAVERQLSATTPTPPPLTQEDLDNLQDMAQETGEAIDEANSNSGNTYTPGHREAKLAYLLFVALPVAVIGICCAKKQQDDKNATSEEEDSETATPEEPAREN